LKGGGENFFPPSVRRERKVPFGEFLDLCQRQQSPKMICQVHSESDRAITHRQNYNLPGMSTAGLTPSTKADGRRAGAESRAGSRPGAPNRADGEECLHAGIGQLPLFTAYISILPRRFGPVRRSKRDLRRLRVGQLLLKKHVIRGRTTTIDVFRRRNRFPLGGISKIAFPSRSRPWL